MIATPEKGTAQTVHISTVRMQSVSPLSFPRHMHYLHISADIAAHPIEFVPDHPIRNRTYHVPQPPRAKLDKSFRWRGALSSDFKILFFVLYLEMKHGV
jgi:hypothetical protein